MQTNRDFVSNDEVALQILLFLRGGNHFSLHEISKVLSQPMNEIWNRIILLEKYRLIEVDDGEYKLSKGGASLLLELGYNIPEINKEKKPKKYSDVFNIHPFDSFLEFVYWLLAPLTLLALFMMVIFIVAQQVLSFELGITIELLLGVLLIVYCIVSFRNIPEYERLVIFRVGKCVGERGPGPVLLLPILDKPQSVDLRVKSQEVSLETCITQDNVQLDVDFVFYWKIQDPIWSITKVTDAEESIRLLATALLRAVIAHFKFNDVLNQRESINDLLKEKIDEISADWGVYVTTMEIREIKPPKEIVDSMHKQVSAEWNRKAIIIEADGQAESIRMLNEVVTLVGEDDFNKIARISGFGPSNSIERIVQTRENDKALLAKKRFQNSPELDVFHVELLLPDLLPIQDFYRKIEEVIKAIDFVYSFIVVLYKGEDDAIREVMGLINTSMADEKTSAVSTASITPFLYSIKAEPLLIVSSSYGSPASFDFLGLGKILEVVSNMLKDVIWRGKHERQMAILEHQSKEIDLEKSRLENNQMQIEIINKQLDIVDKVNNLRLSSKERQLIISAILPKLLTIAHSEINPQLMFKYDNDGNEKKKLPSGRSIESAVDK